MPPHAESSNRSELGHAMSTPDDPIVIDTQGDLLLIVHYNEDLTQYYRVSVSVLRKQSSYFDNLLDTTKFSEGIAVDANLAQLRMCHKDVACVPSSALPAVTISDIGIGSADARTNLCESSFRLLLEILHGCLQWSIVKTRGYVRPIILALLAHYAEAFAAVPAVATEVHALSEKGYIRGSARPTKDVREDKSRQKIYAGLILDLPDWVQTHSAALIIWGSKRWMGENDPSNSVDAEEYPWDYLSGGVEEELHHRRCCVLNTLSSLQSHFLQLYSSRQTQCKLSYDSSPQCDSFQLGEMVRFFTRKGTLRLQSAMSGTYQDSEPFQGHLLKLVQSLKECPSYQLDGFHRHCGLRTRFIPRLECVDLWSHVGLCLHCWKKERSQHSWVESPNREVWWCRVNKSLPRCGHGRFQAKEMYTSPCQDWTMNEILPLGRGNAGC